MLTPKQHGFVSEYLVDLNAAKAELRAGCRGHTANEQGAQLRKRPQVLAAIDAAKMKRTNTALSRQGIGQTRSTYCFIEKLARHSGQNCEHVLH
ncbi:terminase small subunit [Bosea sp. 124]|uniref:terminase small subunit n=1 Tax=Bosea sp. 124 TaxID=2135642 RepID=UPI000D3B956C|nr:terminase small subunit [Bosea sp. 124]